MIILTEYNTGRYVGHFDYIDEATAFLRQRYPGTFCSIMTFTSPMRLRATYSMSIPSFLYKTDVLTDAVMRHNALTGDRVARLEETFLIIDATPISYDPEFAS